jgi:hypothetical protein
MILVLTNLFAALQVVLKAQRGFNDQSHRASLLKQSRSEVKAAYDECT